MSACIIRAQILDLALLMSQISNSFPLFIFDRSLAVLERVNAIPVDDMIKYLL